MGEMVCPQLKCDHRECERCVSCVCGIDEAGRGALAGPLCVAAVQIGPSYPENIRVRLADSKVLSAHQRAERAAEIFQYSARWAVSWATVAEIDTHNVLQATLLAMCYAYRLLCGIETGQQVAHRSILGSTGGWAYRAQSDVLPLPQCVIVDGPHIPPRIDADNVVGMIQADAKIAAVQAASILAKTHRDAWMRTRAHRYFPQYHFDQHKGYPTKFHRQIITAHGRSPIHRTSFKNTAVS